MRIEVVAKFKSLMPFSIELPDFVILTGLNGAGKTQILSVIAGEDLSATSPMTGLNAQNIVQGAKVVADNGELMVRKQIVSSFTLESSGNSAVVTKEIANQNIQVLWNLIEMIRPQFTNLDLPIDKSSFTQQITSVFESFNSRGYNVASAQQIRIIDKIMESSGRNVFSLTNKELYDFYPADDFSQSGNIFQQNFSIIFKKYHIKLERNDQNEYFNKFKNREDVKFLDRDAFLENYGQAPWDVLNRILIEAKLDYCCNSPLDTDIESSFQFKLFNTITRSEVNLYELSSGEKVLMLIVLALYNSKTIIEFPQLLLMDEPDASLHPSMAKQFIDIIHNIFVKEKGMKVIIATHSPSTIAFAPEESIYVVNKTGMRIEKTSKDAALKILTSGVPSFSISYENRRQVFVESPNDVLFYEKLYRVLSIHLLPDVSLSFISSGESRKDKNGMKIANCAQVISIVDVLRRAGNKFVWGIIDWDKENEDKAFVKVLGNGNRYSIENYLLDPILIAALLLREKIISREQLGILNSENYSDIVKLEQSRIQIISDFIVNSVLPLMNTPELGKLDTVLLNGKIIQIDIRYLHHQGHNLEELLLIAFPQLNSLKKGKEEGLKLEVISKVIDDFPELVSADLVEIFKAVQAL